MRRFALSATILVLSTLPLAGQTRPQVLPAGLSDARLLEVVGETRFEAVWQVGTPFQDLPAAWQAPNRARDLRSYFDASGVRVTPFASECWTLRLGARSLGRGVDEARLAPAALRVDGSRVELQRPGLCEWYVNDERGLEQGWTLDAAPGGTGLLRIGLAAQVELETSVSGDGRRVTFKTEAGKVAASLGGLVAFDADGRRLPARFVQRGLDLAIEVDDADARYPVTVDPLVVNEDAQLLVAGAPPKGNFGLALALDGGRLVVGAPGTGLASAGSAYVFVRGSAGEWSLESKLREGPSARTGNGFGRSVDIHGTSLIVGVPGGNDRRGMAVVYELGSGGWAAAQTLVASNGAESDNFGRSVSIDHFWILVGATGRDHPGAENRGAVYAYEHDGSTWSQIDILTGSLAGADAFFGLSLDMDFGWAAVGSRGQAYIFRFTATNSNWSEAQRLNPAQAPSPEYGRLVRLQDGRAYVGDVEAVDASGVEAGAVHVFGQSGTFFSHQAVLVPSDGSTSRRFPESMDVSGGALAVTSQLAFQGSAYVFRPGAGGWSETTYMPLPVRPKAVAFDGATLAIGAPLEDGLLNAEGHVEVYEEASPDQWQLQAELAGHNSDPGDLAGFSVAVEGDLAALGAIFDDDAGYRAGAVYVLEREGAGWQLRAKLRESNVENGHFGYSLDIEDGHVAVGTPGTAGGKVHLFARFENEIWSDYQTLSMSSGLDFLGGSLDIDGDRMLVGASRYADSTGPRGGAFVFTRVGNSWGSPERLILDGAAEDDLVGSRVALSGDTAVLSAPGLESGSGAPVGAILVFEYVGAGWSFRQRIDSPSSGPGAFGGRVAVDGDWLAVGEDLPGKSFVHLYRRTGSAWVHDETLQADTAGFVAFGQSLAMEFPRLVVGVPWGLEGSGQPEAVVYRRAGTSWTTERVLRSSDFDPSDDVGFQVAIDGSRVVLGASGADDGAGKGYVFDIGAPASFVEYCFGDGTAASACPCGNAGGPGEGCANSSGLGARLVASGSSSVSAGDLVLTVHGASPGRPAILFSGDAALGGSPFGDGLRCVGGATRRHTLRTIDAAGSASWGPGLAERFLTGPGESAFAQVWYRDPLGPCDSLFGLSAAIEVFLTP